MTAPATPGSGAPLPGAVPRLDLLWLPVGAGSRVAPRASRWWEHLVARREGRRPLPLVHAALRVDSFDGGLVVEMAPAWSGPPGCRGVVATGPVGIAQLGRLRAFRYEVRCWSGGVVPDAEHAIRVVTLDRGHDLVRRTAVLVADVPTPVWGRALTASGEMWTSNSVVSWLLTRLGHPQVRPPRGTRAPGWDLGIEVALGGAATSS